MDEEKIIDQSQLAEDLSNKISYEMIRHFLVKPLEPVMVKKEFSKPVVKDNTPKKDENGIEAVDIEDVETEVKEVESDFRKGVVLKVPNEYKNQMNSGDWPAMKINIGDVVIYRAKAGMWFDLLKDTQLIMPFDIVCIEKPKN